MLQDVIKAVEEYKVKFRRSGLPDFRWSEPYELFPKEGSARSLNRWPAEWPHSKETGVYFVFGDDRRLLYIGKASMNHCIGKRLSTYFGTERPTGKCVVLDVDGWKGTPTYVAALAVPKEMSFEAAAIEEYLIDTLRPPANTLGVRRPHP